MANNDMDALFDAQVTAGDNQIKRIASLIQDEREANDQIDTAEAMAAEAKERRNNIRQKLLPEAMLDANMREFVTADGIKAKLAFATDGSLGSPKTAEESAERNAKLDVIEEHGGGEIIKVVVSVAFGKDDFDLAKRFQEWVQKQLDTKKELKGKGLRAFFDRTVNHMTLGAWVRSRMEDEDVERHLPPSFFEKVGLWYGEIAKITMPKPKK